METHLFWWQTALFYGRKFVTWLQAHQVPCTCLQHTTLRLGCHPYRREMNTTVPKCYIHIIFPQMPEKDEIFFSPPGKKENQKIQCYFPGKYLEMSHLFSSRKEFPTTNTTTSKAIVHCFLIPEIGRFIKSPFGQMIYHFKPTPSNWFSLSPIISLHWQSHCSLLPIDLGRYVHGGA